jgi:hypothetical protein
MENHNFKNERETLKTKGWVLIKNVFNRTEIEQFRKDAITYRKSDQTGDLLSDKSLNKIITDDRILNIASGLLQDTPVYFGDSTATVHSIDNRISHGFHKDSADKNDGNAPDFKTEYSILRVGIYLQDHSKHSQGLIVRDGSHKVANTTTGTSVNVPSEPGDVIVWYLTTTHSGNAKRLKHFKNLVVADDGVSKLSHFVYYRMPPFMLAAEEKERISLFMTFSKNDDHYNRYIKYLKKRAYALETWKNSKWDTNLLKEISSKNMILKNLPEDMRNSSEEQNGGGVFELDY